MLDLPHYAGIYSRRMFRRGIVTVQDVRRSYLKRMKMNVNSTSFAPVVAGFRLGFPTSSGMMPRNTKQFRTEPVGPLTRVQNSNPTAASTCESNRRNAVCKTQKTPSLARFRVQPPLFVVLNVRTTDFADGTDCDSRQ
jgi:hypothetical protein